MTCVVKLVVVSDFPHARMTRLIHPDCLRSVEMGGSYDANDRNRSFASHAFRGSGCASPLPDGWCGGSPATSRALPSALWLCGFCRVGFGPFNPCRCGRA